MNKHYYFPLAGMSTSRHVHERVKKYLMNMFFMSRNVYPAGGL